MPLSPASEFFQNSSTVLPLGDKMPMPVMTTRGRRLRDRRAICTSGSGRYRSSNNWSNMTGSRRGGGRFLINRSYSTANGFEDIGFYGAFCHPNRVLDRNVVRTPMPNNNYAVHAQQGR